MIAPLRGWQLPKQIRRNRVHVTPEIAVEDGTDRDLGAQRRGEPVAVAQPWRRRSAMLLVPALDDFAIVIREVPMFTCLLIGAVLRVTRRLRRGREGRHAEGP